MAGRTTFDSYDASTLDRIGSTFVRDAKALDQSMPRLGTEVWTEAVLNWFFHARMNQATSVYARPNRGITGQIQAPELAQFRDPRDTQGEFMLDLCHTTFPPGTWQTSPNWWEIALSDSRRILFALESEWGKNRSEEASKALILDDASKPAFVSADTKALLFASSGELTFDAVRTEVGKVQDLAVGAHGDGARTPWLLIDVPWDTGKVHYDVLT